MLCGFSRFEVNLEISGHNPALSWTPLRFVDTYYEQFQTVPHKDDNKVQSKKKLEICCTISVMSSPSYTIGLTNHNFYSSSSPIMTAVPPKGLLVYYAKISTGYWDFYNSYSKELQKRSTSGKIPIPIAGDFTRHSPHQSMASGIS